MRRRNWAGNYQCPCCDYFTFGEPGGYEICPVCRWEDDWYQTENPPPDGGPNKVSLVQARRNFQELGAMESRFQRLVRPPLPDELPDTT